LSVSNIAKCGASYQLTTKDAAQALCVKNGGVLANYAQLEEAFKAGFSVCACGWLDGGSVKYSTVGKAGG
jgi:hypothetical protein